MVITTGTGEVYQDKFDMLSKPFRPAEEGSDDLSSGQKEGQKFDIDRDHHVPLLASAIMGEDGNMTGLAIDHRAKLSGEDEELLHLHEATELPYMNDLVKGGMKPSDAYTEAHKWATARETAASIAKWGEEGHEAYQQRMRDAASIAKEPTDRDRHPDAHTTKYGLDESELGQKYAGLLDYMFGGEKKLDIGKAPLPQHYPTDEEADLARKSGFGYGRRDEPYLEGKRERRGAIQSGDIGRAMTKLATTGSTDIPKSDMGLREQQSARMYTKAALVANRSPVTALGWDPSKATIESTDTKYNVLGLHYPATNEVWSSSKESDIDPASLAHEFTHRGLLNLKNSGVLNEPEKMWLEGNEESFVRHLMQKYGGNVKPLPDERGHEEWSRLERRSRNLFENPEDAKMGDEIEKKAQDLYHEKYGKGPH